MMDETRKVAQVAWALADPLRLSILQHLMGGPAVVSELVSVTGESQSKVSNHLKVLRERGLVRSERRGRQSVYEISGASVAQLIESLTVVAGGPVSPVLGTDPLAQARTCYDHLAGGLGVSLFGALVEAEAILPTAEIRGDVVLGSRAEETFRSVGVEPAEVEQNRGRRRFAFACPDWTEHRPHLGGALGAAVCGRFFEEGWIAKDEKTRVVRVTDAGTSALEEHLGLVNGARGA
jgi:DNA-binding transcriptional ArsR family regulator